MESTVVELPDGTEAEFSAPTEAEVQEKIDAYLATEFPDASG